MLLTKSLESYNLLNNVKIRKVGFNGLFLHCSVELSWVLLGSQIFSFPQGNGIGQKSSSEVRAYIDYLHVIDNQQTLFELSHRLEPRA